MKLLSGGERWKGLILSDACLESYTASEGERFFMLCKPSWLGSALYNPDVAIDNWVSVALQIEPLLGIALG